MEEEKTDNRSLETINNTYEKVKRSIDVLLRALDKTTDLKSEMKKSLVYYIMGETK